MGTPDPDDRGTAPDKRGLGAPARRSAGYLPESNVASGGLIELVQLREYLLYGFDIGSASLDKPGLREGLDQLMAEVAALDRRLLTVKLIGSASNSRIEGVNPFAISRARAEAVAMYFRAHRVHVAQVDGWGGFKQPPPKATPPEKAISRSVHIVTHLSALDSDADEQGPVPPNTAPVVPPDPVEPPSKLTIAKAVFKIVKALVTQASPAGLVLKIAELQYKLALTWGHANAAGIMEGAQRQYALGFGEAMADLTDGHPENHIEKYMQEGRKNVDALSKGMLEMRVSDGAAYGLLYDGWRSLGRRHAADVTIHMGRTSFTAYAARIREMYPDPTERRRALEAEMLQQMREADRRRR